jgi:hypothetical protein
MRQPLLALTALIELNSLQRINYLQKVIPAQAFDLRNVFT